MCAHACVTALWWMEVDVISHLMQGNLELFFSATYGAPEVSCWMSCLCLDEHAASNPSTPFFIQYIVQVSLGTSPTQ